MSKVIIVGGGAAGMFCAINCGYMGHEVTIIEQNEKTGKKIYITGKGRCNVTNECDSDTFFNSVKSNPKFMYSSFNGFDSSDTMNFFENNGCKLKTERGNRVFPVSDHASDIIKALNSAISNLGIEVRLRTKVTDLIIEEGCAKGVELANGEKLYADAVVVATGGLSYPSTGSKGDGYEFAKKAGHSIVKPMPALVPLNTKEAYVNSLQGLSLRNVTLTAYNNKGKVVYSEFGEMLFTHFGISGPLVLTLSSICSEEISADKPLKISVDLKPTLDLEQLDKRLLRDFEEGKNKNFGNCLSKLFPNKLIPVMIELSGISPTKKVNEITKEERMRFAELIKNLEMTAVSRRDFNEAIITKGGISVKDINPKTMESKLVKALYFVGEVLDVDALTGGFNLQIAWSSAYAAAMNI